jgi:DNA polymerase III epsilon subunit-like protein
MTKILVFDTETTGLPKKRNASMFKPDDWPHVVQLSFLLYDAGKNTIVDSGDYIVKLPAGVEIEPGAAAVHGITDEQCEREGITMYDALLHFNRLGATADVFVAHNISFDKRQIIVESTRLNMGHPFGYTGNWKPVFCTMKETTEMCKIAVKSERTGETYYKYPKLSELHNYMFGYVPNGLHDSMADILICLRCYLQLIYKRDIIYDNKSFAFMWRERCVGGDILQFNQTGLS